VEPAASLQRDKDGSASAAWDPHAVWEERIRKPREAQARAKVTHHQK
jgi:hypothetical protein